MSGELPPIRNSSDRSCWRRAGQPWRPSLDFAGETHELTVDISAHRHWASHRLDVRLLDQDLPRLIGVERESACDMRVTESAKQRTLSHSLLTSISVSCLQSVRCEIPASCRGCAGGEVRDEVSTGCRERDFPGVVVAVPSPAAFSMLLNASTSLAQPPATPFCSTGWRSPSPQARRAGASWARPATTVSGYEPSHKSVDTTWAVRAAPATLHDAFIAPPPVRPQADSHRPTRSA